MKILSRQIVNFHKDSYFFAKSCKNPCYFKKKLYICTLINLL